MHDVGALLVAQVQAVAAGVPSACLADMLTSLADLLAIAPHLEFIMSWVRAVCLHHATTLATAAQSGNGTAVGIGGSLSSPVGGGVAPPMRALSRAVAKVHQDLTGAAERNMFALEYLCGPLREGEEQEGDDDEEADVDASHVAKAEEIAA